MRFLMKMRCWLLLQEINISNMWSRKILEDASFHYIEMYLPFPHSFWEKQNSINRDSWNKSLRSYVWREESYIVKLTTRRLRLALPNAVTFFYSYRKRKLQPSSVLTLTSVFAWMFAVLPECQPFNLLICSLYVSC